jgi:N-acyl-L-homoserine lactone synthetase
MFQIMSLADLTAAPMLRQSMLRHRAQQFVGRHGWSLRLTGDLEIDEFDADGTRYGILSEDGRHLASIRLRHARDGSMVERFFPSFWDDHRALLRDLPEVTRLCIAPRSDPDWRSDALVELLVGLCGHCLRAGTDRFFGIVYPSVARNLARAGWPPAVIGQRKRQGDDLVLAVWTVSHRTHWDLQTVLERRHEAQWACAGDGQGYGRLAA